MDYIILEGLVGKEFMLFINSSYTLKSLNTTYSILRKSSFLLKTRCQNINICCNSFYKIRTFY